MRTIQFSVSVPTDNGFLGRQCNSPNCARYFKVRETTTHEEMFCPYCGERFSRQELFTPDQVSHVRAQAAEKAKELASDAVDKMLRNFGKGFTSGPVRIKTYRAPKYKAKTITPKYREQEVDSELTCPQCRLDFQVFGIFGFCPGCRTENQLIYDANLAILRQEIATATDQERALRHAYSDLVSAFEGFCRRRAIGDEFARTNFQNLSDARKAFLDHRGLDILDGLQGEELLGLRRVFQKRHAHSHNNGIIDERYVRNVPEDSAFLNQRAQLSVEEFEAAAKALRSIIGRIATLKRS